TARRARPQGGPSHMNLPMFDLTGRVAFVTGSSRGIGRAFAEILADAGATVIVNSRNPADVEAARAARVDSGRTADSSACDSTDPAAVEATVARIEDEVGPIDILFSNAGIQRRAPLAEMPIATWREVMA